MVFEKQVEVKGNKYWILIHSVRKGGKVIQRKKYIGKVLPSRKKLEQIKHEFLKDIQKNELTSRKDIQRIKIKILPLLRKYRVEKAGIFGSHARGDYNKKSDIDILILPPKGMGLEFFGLNLELEDKLKRKVDLVSYRSIHPLLKERILKEEVKIL